MRYRSADGEWTVEVIRLALTGINRDGEWLRVSRWGCFVESSGIAADGRASP